VKHWPWITTIVAVVVFALTPLGWEIMSGLASGEALSRNIAGGFLMTVVLPILLVLGLLEWLMWRKLNAAPNYPTGAPTTISNRQKPDKSEA
jgi:hypothetical protein